MTLDLDAIRARYDKARETGNLGNIDDSMADVPALLAEVEALRAELDERIRRLASHRGVIEQQRAHLALHLSPECQHANAHNGCDGTVVCKGRCWCECHDEEARTERTEPAPLPPASNELREHPGHGQPMEGVEFPADGTEHELTEPATGEDDLPGMWEAADLTGGETDCSTTGEVQPQRREVQSEPATGEDVEKVARLLYADDNRYDELGDGWERLTDGYREQYRRSATKVLAALDLPGRVEALRKRVVEWQQQCTSLADRLNAATAERDAANAALAMAKADLESMRREYRWGATQWRAERDRALAAAEMCPHDCDYCHDEDCPCPRLGCAGEEKKPTYQRKLLPLITDLEEK